MYECIVQLSNFFLTLNQANVNQVRFVPIADYQRPNLLWNTVTSIASSCQAKLLSVKLIPWNALRQEFISGKGTSPVCLGLRRSIAEFRAVARLPNGSPA